MAKNKHLQQATKATDSLQATFDVLKRKYGEDLRIEMDTLKALQQIGDDQIYIRAKMDKELTEGALQLKQANILTTQALKFLYEIEALSERHLAFIASVQGALTVVNAEIRKSAKARERPKGIMLELEQLHETLKLDFSKYERGLELIEQTINQHS